MKHIILVTGNAHKLKEWQAIMPADITLESRDLDLPEIQSIDPLEIVADKARRAYEAIGQPVVVEDVSAELVKLNGLPGPFVKFFNKALGGDALYQLAGRRDGEKAIVSCSIAYYDGEKLLTVRGDVPGSVVAPRGESDFGFDIVFVPEGETQTYAEMPEDKKNALSHRRRAIELFLRELHRG